MNAGFVGLGKMGSGMVRSLLRGGHRVAVYNRSREKAQALATDGARVAESLAEVCRGADAVFTMLSDDAAVEQVVFGEGGLAASLEGATTHVSSSTIGTRMARRLAEEHASRAQRFLSAPVFGRPEAAEASKLLVVVAGESGEAERLAPLFAAIGRQTFRAGAEPWQANAMKLCGNFMIASMLESFSEAVALLRKADTDAHVFLDAMTALFGSPVYANYGRMVVDERFEPAGFALRLGLKDVRLVLETAEACEAPMPVASLIRDRMLSAMALGQADMDWSSVANVSARGAGL